MERDPLYTEDPIETEANLLLVQWAYQQGWVYPGLQITHELLDEWRAARLRRLSSTPDLAESPHFFPDASQCLH